MWNPFKKNSGNANSTTNPVSANDKDEKEDTQKMGMLQRLAMKKMMSMSPQEREKLAQEMFKPENKDKLLSAMEMMKKTGQITDAQIAEAKKKMGL
ncbi:MAG: hypothetical protein WC238_00575 [Parcubacteria group bacterium]|jgi:hypothetical protein